MLSNTTPVWTADQMAIVVEGLSWMNCKSFTKESRSAVNRLSVLRSPLVLNLGHTLRERA